MKCPYRIKKMIYKGVSHGAYAMKSNDIREEFEECYGESCPLYIGFAKCARAEAEKVDMSRVRCVDKE